MQDLEQTIAWSAEAVELVKRLHAERKSFHNEFGSFRSPFMSLVRADGALDLYHGGLRAQDEHGATIFDGVDYDRYCWFCADGGNAGAVAAEGEP